MVYGGFAFDDEGAEEPVRRTLVAVVRGGEKMHLDLLSLSLSSGGGEATGDEGTGRRCGGPGGGARPEQKPGGVFVAGLEEAPGGLWPVGCVMC